MGTDTNRNVTLSSVLSTLSPLEHIFVLHRMGPHELEAVGGGTVQELKDRRCVEVCGDNMVEIVDLVTDELESKWMNMDTPVWVITIGRKLVTARQKPTVCCSCKGAQDETYL